MSAGDPLTLLPERLGVRWLRLDGVERHRQETAFFSALLRTLGEEPGAAVFAEFANADDAQRFAATWRLRADGCDVTGSSTAEIAWALASERSVYVHIRSANGRMRIELENSWTGVAVWLDADEEDAWRSRLQRAIRTGIADSEPVGEHPGRAAAYVALGHAAWIVPSLLGVFVMMGLSRLGLSLLIAVPLGFVLIGALILGPPVAATRRALDRWLL